jgi:hypothetical protein
MNTKMFFASALLAMSLTAHVEMARDPSPETMDRCEQVIGDMGDVSDIMKESEEDRDEAEELADMANDEELTPGELDIQDGQAENIDEAYMDAEDLEGFGDDDEDSCKENEDEIENSDYEDVEQQEDEEVDQGNMKEDMTEQAEMAQWAMEQHKEKETDNEERDTHGDY